MSSRCGCVALVRHLRNIEQGHQDLPLVPTHTSWGKCFAVPYIEIYCGGREVWEALERVQSVFLIVDTKSDHV